MSVDNCISDFCQFGLITCIHFCSVMNHSDNDLGMVLFLTFS